MPPQSLAPRREQTFPSWRGKREEAEKGVSSFSLGLSARQPQAKL
jgi:hypothetical protein